MAQKQVLEQGPVQPVAGWTASAMVWVGWTAEHDATSPNCRSASTSTTGWMVRLASATARLMATTDFPVPPLVQNTDTTRPGVCAGEGEARAGAAPGQHPRQGAGDGVEELGVIRRDRHDIVDPGPDRLFRSGRQFVDDHDGAAAGPEGHEPGDLGDHGVG